MIRTPRTHNTKLRDIYRRSEPCDTVNFTQNLEMSTNQTYSFVNLDHVKRKMLEQKVKFQNQMDGYTKYALKQCRDVFLEKYEVGDVNDIFDENDCSKNTYLNSPTSKKRYIKPYSPPHFDFVKIYQNYVKKQKPQKKVDHKKRMQMRDINSIGESRFFQKCYDYEDFQQVISDIKPVQSKDVKDKELADQMRKYITFWIYKRIQGIKGMQSQKYSVNILKDLKLVRFKDQKVQMPTSLDDNTIITKNQMLSLSRFAYRPDELKSYFKHKQQLHKQQMLIQKDDNIEGKLESIKKEIKILLEKIKKKHNFQRRDRQAQTQKLITSQYIKDLISVEDQAAVFKIMQLVMIKQNQLKQGLNPKMVYQKLHPLISRYLFDLIIIISSGETFITWADFVLMDDSSQVEKLLLQKIYENIFAIDGKLCPNGRTKVELLNFYCKMKLMISSEGGPVFGKPKQKSPPTTPANIKTSQKTNKSISVQKSPNFMSTNKNLKSFMKSTRNFNDTTKQNTTNFNKTKNSAHAQNMQNRIDNLFQSNNSPFAKNSIKPFSKSPMTSKNLHSSSIKKQLTPIKSSLKSSRTPVKNIKSKKF